MATRVLVVDDQAVVRAGFRVVLGAAPDIEVVGEAADGAAGAELAARLRPDVVLMDVRMPGVDGIEGTRRIAALTEPGVRVLIVTTFDPDSHVYDALRAGASGFVLKDVLPEDLQVAVRTVHAGHALFAPSVRRPNPNRGTREQLSPHPAGRTHHSPHPRASRTRTGARERSSHPIPRDERSSRPTRFCRPGPFA